MALGGRREGFERPAAEEGDQVRRGDAGEFAQEKFEIIKSLGFLGVEIDSPSGRQSRSRARGEKKTGIEIHGVIDSVHWKKRCRTPKERSGPKALKALKTALKDGKFYGAATVLLVPGRVDEKPETRTFDAG